MAVTSASPSPWIGGAAGTTGGVATLTIPGAGRAAILNVRVGEHPDRTRVVLDLEGPAPFAYTVSNDGRTLLIDLPRSRWMAGPPTAGHRRGIVSGYRFDETAEIGGRLTVTAVAPMTADRPLVLDPDGRYGHRIVFDLKPRIRPRPDGAWATGPAFARHLNVTYAPRLAQSAPRRRPVTIDDWLSQPPPGQPERTASPPSPPPPPAFPAQGQPDPRLPPDEYRSRPFVDFRIPDWGRSGYYVSASGGLSFLADANNSGDLLDIGSSTDTGYTIVAPLGLASPGGLRLEAEIGYSEYELDSLDVTRGGNVTGLSVGLSDAEGDASILSPMANAAYDIGTGTALTPFVLGGIGTARVAVNDGRALGVDIVDDADWVFAYQEGVGLNLALSDTCSAGIAYRCFATSDPALEDSAGDDFDTEVSSHTVLFGVRYAF